MKDKKQAEPRETIKKGLEEPQKKIKVITQIKVNRRRSIDSDDHR